MLHIREVGSLSEDDESKKEKIGLSIEGESIATMDYYDYGKKLSVMETSNKVVDICDTEIIMANSFGQSSSISLTGSYPLQSRSLSFFESS